VYIISGWQWGVQEVSLVVHPLIGLAEWCPLAAMMNATCLPPPPTPRKTRSDCKTSQGMPAVTVHLNMEQG
jgi:hypothetical protein